MVWRGKGQLGAVNPQTAFGQFAQRCGTHQIVDQMPIDMQQGCAVVVLSDDMAVPQLVKKRPLSMGLRLHGRYL